MTEVAVQGRLEKLMETDWRSLAAKLLEDRLQKLKDGKNAYVSLSNRLADKYELTFSFKTFEL